MRNNYDRQISALDFNFWIGTCTCIANKNVSMPWERSFSDGLLTSGDSSVNIPEHLKKKKQFFDEDLRVLFLIRLSFL